MDRPLVTIDQLQAAGLIAPGAAGPVRPVAERFAVALTPHVAGLIAREGVDGPIARQYLPDPRELDIAAYERADPIADRAFEVLPGVVRRYPDRVLFKLTEVCPVYCRFCFRREMVGRQGRGLLEPGAFDAACAWVGAHSDIFEVILTGGDPFVVSARRAERVSRALGAIGHLSVVRWHTRVPVADPDRVTPAFVRALRAGPARSKAVIVVVHVNHAAELVPEALAAIGRLVDAGIPVLSQSVLLRGINDEADTLEALLRALVRARVKPYYLHQGDLAPGTGHWRTALTRGPDLLESLRGRLPGHALPTLVIDVPDGAGKVPLAGALAPGGIRDRFGTLRPHPEHGGD